MSMRNEKRTPFFDGYRPQYYFRNEEERFTKATNESKDINYNKINISVEEEKDNMKNLEVLKGKAEGFKCSNCKTRGNRLIAPSVTIEGQYYITCMTCGSVTVAKEGLGANGEVAFTVNETSKTKKTMATERLMEDAMRSYEAMGYPLAHMCMTPRDAEKYVLKEEIKKELLDYAFNLFDDNEEDELYDNPIGDCEESCRRKCTNCHDNIEAEPLPLWLDKHKDRQPSITIDNNCGQTDIKATGVTVENGCITTEMTAAGVDIKKRFIVVVNGVVEARYKAKDMSELQELVDEKFAGRSGDIEIFEIANIVSVEKKLVLR